MISDNSVTHTGCVRRQTSVSTWDFRTMPRHDGLWRSVSYSDCCLYSYDYSATPQSPALNQTDRSVAGHVPDRRRENVCVEFPSGRAVLSPVARSIASVSVECRRTYRRATTSLRWHRISRLDQALRRSVATTASNTPQPTRDAWLAKDQSDVGLVDAVTNGGKRCQRDVLHSFPNTSRNQGSSRVLTINPLPASACGWKTE